MSKCAVAGCKSEHNPFNAAVSFHRITRNKKYLPLWQRVVKIKTKSIHAKICSLHFKDQDFVEGKGRRILKPHAVPSFNVIDGDTSTDDEDSEKLSILKTLLTASKGASIATESTEKISSNSDSENDVCGPNSPHNFQMVMSCCEAAQSANPLNAKQTSNMGIQTKIKTDKEISLQAKVKLLELRLRRRDAKISYMQTVLNMIKKHTKGTDMKYKLCCELQNITEPIESSFKFEIKSHNNETVWKDDEGSSGEDDSGTFVEVVHSPNLRAANGF